ncbi:hypothetical protein WJX74_010760 [Apatococcus lobatus]|uniref:Uncharacterized protein n=1 Tax=Apatococcus lobatus TaxID=904363 RepID=A0AAW1SHT2_9CHLO
MSRSNYAQGFAQDLSSKNDPQLEAALDGVRTSFDKPPVRRSMDGPLPTQEFKLPHSATTTIPENKPAVMTSEEGYKQTNYFNSHQRKSMDQNRPRRSLSNGELESLDKPVYPESTVLERPPAGEKPVRSGGEDQ